MKTAVFTGSFDPFTIGHKNVVDRVLSLFEHIVIGVGYNERKKGVWTVEQRVSYIKKVYEAELRVEVKSYNDLSVDFAKRENAVAIIKGVRSIKDFEYEREQAEINRLLSGTETLFIFSDAKYASISSSLLRELQTFGRDITEFLPLKIDDNI